jgi:hypothetical protein
MNARLPIVNAEVEDDERRNVAESSLCAADHKTHHILWRTDPQREHISDSSLIRSGFGRDVNDAAKTARKWPKLTVC